MALQVNDFIDAVSDFERRGYNHDFRIKDGQLLDLTVGKPITTTDIQVDASLRFESSPEAGDRSNIYAITNRRANTKGLLIDAFDVLDSDCTPELYDCLSANRVVSRFADDDIPSRYGLRKVYKEEFDQDPERFVLRIDFPDFPECPFGQSFSMLGFDLAEQRYVWLVTSILRDSRLSRVPFQAVDVPDNT
ncbi:hypothetical protein V1291_003947 [Nitrobacteraceae bacterium AZCC 1564]